MRIFLSMVALALAGLTPVAAQMQYDAHNPGQAANVQPDSRDYRRKKPSDH